MRAMGHFVIGAAMAYVNGANPLAGGSAAVAAENAGDVLAEMYNDGVTAINEKGEFDPALLPEEAKLEISSLTSAIAGIAMSTGDNGALFIAQIGSVIGKNASDNNNLRLFISIGRITYKIYRYYKKVGKLRSADIARMVIDEGLSIVQNIDTLTDGELNVDDALAILDIVVGLKIKSGTFNVIKDNPRLPKEILTRAKNTIKNSGLDIDMLNKTNKVNPIPSKVLRKILDIYGYKKIVVETGKNQSKPIEVFYNKKEI